MEDFEITVPPRFTAEEAAKHLVDAINASEQFVPASFGLAIRGGGGADEDIVVLCPAARVMSIDLLEPKRYIPGDPEFSLCVAQLNDHRPDILGQPIMRPSQMHPDFWTVEVFHSDRDGHMILGFEVGGGTTHPSDSHLIDPVFDPPEDDLPDDKH